MNGFPRCLPDPPVRPVGGLCAFVGGVAASFREGARIASALWSMRGAVRQFIEELEELE